MYRTYNSTITDKKFKIIKFFDLQSLELINYNKPLGMFHKFIY